MDGNIQQIAERRFITEFQNAYQLPEGSISFEDKPDVILIGERKIGIEITNFYVNGGKKSGGKKSYCEQSHRKLRKKLILASQEKWSLKGSALDTRQLTWESLKGSALDTRQLT